MQHQVFSGGSELLEEVQKTSTRHPNQKDDKDHRFFFSQNLKLDIYADSNAVNLMADYIVEKSGYNPKQELHRQEFRRHIIIIILNLSKCVMNRQWCKIPLRNNAFGKGKTYNNLSYKHFKRAIETLERLEFIDMIKGANYRKQAVRSVMQPKSAMHGRVMYAYLESIDINEDYVSVTEQTNELSESDIAQMEQDRKDMQLINEFLSTHSWAAKSSINRNRPATTSFI